MHLTKEQNNKVTRYFLLVLYILLSACAQEEAAKPKKKGRAHLVETTVVERVNIGVSRTRTGTLRSHVEVKIYNQEAGQITQLPYYEGDSVKIGDVVAKLDDRLLRAQLDRVKATRRKAEQDLRRVKSLVGKKLVSEEELTRSETDLEVTRADEKVLLTRLGYSTIVAPINGLVIERLTEPGNVAERYAHLLTIADPASLITEVSVSELVLTHLTVGDSALVSIDALGGDTFAGKIVRIHPNLNPITRQGIIEVELNPVPQGARPGQLCRVQLNTQISDRMMIPFRALRRDRDNEYVFRIDANQKVERTKVLSGQRLAERVEILQGLDVGERIVTKGFLGLAPGKKVKIVSANQKNNNKSGTGGKKGRSKQDKSS